MFNRSEFRSDQTRICASIMDVNLIHLICVLYVKAVAFILMMKALYIYIYIFLLDLAVCDWSLIGLYVDVVSCGMNHVYIQYVS